MLTIYRFESADLTGRATAKSLLNLQKQKSRGLAAALTIRDDTNLRQMIHNGS